ncbi:uncharacterized protein P174DRAFT_416781 [Aspergillus novofumigatus IBT 16806]|uniref:Uncharacterized protein n=1 Tax=Aspergillus novofumigatus (strain IBT 16806) TaxID=1392255 RepID=A0A2I1CNA2_ASPN1|nr:uncharacterized protein P174DRAFT_416781 [Aspergillus novofumigatus IBT 16806]PKX99082.1 hypothetical protein P174DRAFT_416781 [Aspergillus novofumigatus IBT 16806]
MSSQRCTPRAYQLAHFFEIAKDATHQRRTVDLNFRSMKPQVSAAQSQYMLLCGDLLVSRLPDQFEERAQPLYFTRNPRKLSQMDIIRQELPYIGFLELPDEFCPDLQPGDAMMVNFNVEEPESHTDWYAQQSTLRFLNNARRRQIHAYLQRRLIHNNNNGWGRKIQVRKGDPGNTGS